MKSINFYTLVLFVLTGFSVYSQDGSLDVTFSGGKVNWQYQTVNNFFPAANTTLIANDGIVGAMSRFYGGTKGVTTLPYKLNSNGSLAWGLNATTDTIDHFLARGTVSDDAHARVLFYGGAYFGGAGILPDSSFAQLAFLDTLGKPVTWLGNNGKLTIDITPNSYVAGAAFTSAGQILCLVKHPNVAQDSMYAYFTRIDTNGTVDLSYGNNGKALIPVSVFFETRNPGFGLLNNDKVVYWFVTGYTTFATYATRCLQANGTPDLSFGNGGQLVADSLEPVQILNEKLWMNAPYSGTSSFTAAIFNSDGTPYSAFGTNGRINLNLNPGYGFGGGVMQPDGKFVLGGFNNSDFALMRLNANGSIDNTFGSSGYVTTDFYSGIDAMHGLLWQKLANKPVAVGYSQQGLTIDANHVVAARYNVTVASGIGEPVNEIKGIIYPNPATGKIYCSANANITGVEIYNYTGALVKQSPQSTVDVSDLQNGMYLVMIKTSTGTQTEKLIKVD